MMPARQCSTSVKMFFTCCAYKKGDNDGFIKFISTFIGKVETTTLVGGAHMEANQHFKNPPNF